jgi:hypothetical protein
MPATIRQAIRESVLHFDNCSTGLRNGQIVLAGKKQNLFASRRMIAVRGGLAIRR